MNKADKIMITRNPQAQVNWQNSRIITGDVVAQIKKLKNSSEKDMAILGSGSIINLFTENNLIDEYQIMIDPVAIGSGTSVFSGIRAPLTLKLNRVRTFKSGVVLLYYHGTN
jgi:dihydrofolate reductase